MNYTIESTEAGQRVRQGLYAGEAGREMAVLNAGLINSANPAAGAQVVPAETAQQEER